MIRSVLAAIGVIFFTSTVMAVSAPVITKTIEYRDGSTVLEGFYAYPSQAKGKLPTIIMVHAWKGLGDYEKSRAQEMAAWGYAVFAIDMYGKGVRPKTNEEAAALSSSFKNNRKLMRSRARSGMDFAKTLPQVDGSKIVATGFCFGGGTALELARSGAPILGVASFHGSLDTPTPQDAVNIKGKVLVMAGADDPYVPTPQVAAFQSEMKAAKTDWQFIYYGNAVHAFTDPSAGNDPIMGAAFNPLAAARSMAAFKVFLLEVFGTPK